LKGHFTGSIVEAKREFFEDVSALQGLNPIYGLEDIKTFNMIKVIIASGKSRQIVTPDILVSTKMRKPSETSVSGLIAIFCLLDKLLNLRVFPNGERSEGIIYNAMDLFAATRSKMLETQSYNFFYLLLVLRQLAQQSIRHTYFEFFHREHLLQDDSTGRGGVGQVIGRPTEGLPIPIKALEAAPTYSWQVLQSLPDRDPSARQGLLNAFTKMIEGQVRGHNHQCLTELDEQDLTPLRELVQLSVFRRDRNSPLLSHSDRFNRPDCSFWHKMAFSFVNISKMRVARPQVACKWFILGLTIPQNVLARAEKVIQ